MKTARLSLCFLSMVLLCGLLALPSEAYGAAGTCPGDINADGQTDVLDILEVLSNWGECPAPCPADLNADGFVDVMDLLAVLEDLGCGVPTCQDSADCDDGDPCTHDICIIGFCFHLPIPGCGQ